MKQIIYAEVESLTDLEFESNFIVKDTVDNKWYVGNDTSTPVEIVTSSTPVYQNLFMLMGA
jgi:hypothetical protein